MRVWCSGSIELAIVVTSVAQEPTVGANHKATAKGPDYVCEIPQDWRLSDVVETYEEGILAVVEMLGRRWSKFRSERRSFEVVVGPAKSKTLSVRESLGTSGIQVEAKRKRGGASCFSSGRSISTPRWQTATTTE